MVSPARIYAVKLIALICILSFAVCGISHAASISGEVYYSGVSTGMLWVGAFTEMHMEENWPDYAHNYIWTTNLGAVTPYSVDLFAYPTSYYMAAYIDTNNNGIYDNGIDPRPEAYTNPYFILEDSSTVSSVSIYVADVSTAPEAAIYTAMDYYGNYWLNFQLKGAVDIGTVTVTGPSIPPTSLNKDVDMFYGDSTLPGVPSIGAEYHFEMIYYDESIDVTSATVTGIMDYFATLLLPADLFIEESPNPIFEWLPAGGPTDTYGIEVVDQEGGWKVWMNYDIPSFQTSITYDSDGMATPLELGKTYEWHIAAVDSDHNAAYSQTFTFTYSQSGSSGSIAGTIYNNSGISSEVCVYYGHGIPGAGWTPLAFTSMTVQDGMSEPYQFDMVSDATDYTLLAILDSNFNGDFNPNDPDFDIASMLYPVIVQGGPATGQDLYLNSVTGSIQGTIYNDTAIGEMVCVYYGHGIPGGGWTPLGITSMTVGAFNNVPYQFTMVADATDYAVYAVLDSNSNGEFNPNAPDFDTADMVYPVMVQGTTTPGIDIHLGGVVTAGELSGIVYNNTDTNGNVIVCYGDGVPGDGWTPIDILGIPIDSGSSNIYNFYNVPDNTNYAVMAFLDNNENGEFDSAYEIADMVYPVEVMGEPAMVPDLTLEGSLSWETTNATISGTIYNDTDYSGPVMLACGNGVPGIQEWEPICYATMTIAARESSPYVLEYLLQHNRYCVVAVLDADLDGEFFPWLGDPTGLVHPIAVIHKDRTGVDIHITNDVFGSISGTVYNDTPYPGSIVVMAGYDLPGDQDDYWMPVSTAAFWLDPGQSAPYYISGIFNNTDCMVAGILDVNIDYEYNPFAGDPAGLKFPVRVDGEVTGTDIHVSTHVFDSISGTVYNDTEFAAPVGIAAGYGPLDLCWYPQFSSSMTFLSPGNSAPFSIPMVYTGLTYSVVGILDADLDEHINPYQGDIMGVAYPVSAAGSPVTDVTVRIDELKISGTITSNAAADGAAPLGNVLVTLTLDGFFTDIGAFLPAGFSYTCYTDADGYYELSNLPIAFDYTITPSKPGWTFIPQNRSYSEIILTQMNQNFTAESTDEAPTEITIPIGIGDTPINVVMPEAGGSKIIMPARPPDRIDKGTINPSKGDEVAIIFNSSEVTENVIGKVYTIRIFNLLGELVEEFEKTPQSSDDTWLKWIPQDIASGIYIIHVNGPGVNVKKKIPILR